MADKDGVERDSRKKLAAKRKDKIQGASAVKSAAPAIPSGEPISSKASKSRWNVILCVFDVALLSIFMVRS